MEYKAIVKATFLERPNRFIASVLIEDKKETVHVKNTGRCKELLIPGCTVYLEKSNNPDRKTKYDLVAVEKMRKGKESLLINIDSQSPNDAAEEWLRSSAVFGENAIIQREYTCGNSRFDFHIVNEEGEHFLEVKGCTLETDGIARFPDAPTERGVKHIRELIALKKQGFDCTILFVIQMKDIRSFAPNDETHKEFGDALRDAKAAGVNIWAYDCVVTKDGFVLDKTVPVVL